MPAYGFWNISGKFQVGKKNNLLMLQNMFPNIADWVENHGWIELGQNDFSSSEVRVLDIGGLIWESDRQYETLDELFHDLEMHIIQKKKELGL